ncbi:hypothetical protein [Marinimicrobium sp. C2-29]|uniref:hypothetical protein n=1 Tax=Marinimicrobium sp. C2-29 TaxID=3139825 RepID=UPI003138698A
MKTLLISLMLMAALVLGGRWFYEYQLEQRLDGQAQALRRMGGELTYETVTLAPNGDIRVEDLQLRLPEYAEFLSIDRVRVHTGSLIGFHRVAFELYNKRLPEAMGLSIDGLRVSPGSAYYPSLIAPVTGTQSRFTTAGCGARSGFSARDLEPMGYTELVLDSDWHYQRTEGGMDLRAEVNTRQMHSLSTHLSLALQMPDRNLTRAGVALLGSRLRSLHLTYHDQGLAPRVMNFCQAETGLDASGFLARHLQAWQEAWNHQGLVAGEDMVDAYRQFLQQPDRWRVDIDPASPLPLGLLLGAAPERWLRQLELSVSVNEAPKVPVELRAIAGDAE